jgi:molybdenum-dependent DNA-binding transcriptional regulator ModE
MLEGNSILLYGYAQKVYGMTMRSNEQTSRRLKLQHLNVFLAVAQTGSMAKGAKRLAISQPVVSRTVANLENSLGVRLFDRSPVGVELILLSQKVAGHRR